MQHTPHTIVYVTWHLAEAIRHPELLLVVPTEHAVVVRLWALGRLGIRGSRGTHWHTITPTTHIILVIHVEYSEQQPCFRVTGGWEGRQAPRVV